MEAIGKLVVLTLVFLGLTLYNAFSWGYVFYRFYRWFILPVFIDLPQISFYQSIGLILFIGVLKNHSTPKEYKDHEELNKEARYITTLLLPWILLIMGAFIYSIIY